MTLREKRVVNAFLNCIDNGEYSVDYAITLIEDNQKYGYLTPKAKAYFYDELEKRFPPETAEEVPAEM